MQPIARLGRYEVIRILGEGAMGTVYEARDPTLGRRVAIKTIRRDNLSGEQAAEYMERFDTEARSAARLQHPNIVSVYDAGHEQDTSFLVMEYVEGIDLKRHSQDAGTLSFMQTMRVARDLLSALDYAHAHGVVHRDVKPANILVDARGCSKLADFGIAKLADAEATRATGRAIGTLRYMSPEQLQGLPVDGRSDLFSAAVLLYQLLTGRPPFNGDNDLTLANQILTISAPPPSALQPGLPPELDRVLGKAMSKQVESRYASAREFASDLRFLMPQDRARNAAIAAQSQRDSEAPTVAVAAQDAVSALSVGKPVSGFAGKPAMAVLPFENMGNDADQAYFADGIAEDILTRLAMWRWLPVIARNSSFAYRGQHVDVKEVGAALGVRYILQGSVRRSGDKIRVTGQLVDAETGHQVWAQRYDRVLADIFDLQDEITDAIVTALEPAVGAAEIVRLRRGGNRDLGAWDVYQRALWNYGQLTKEACAQAWRLSRTAAEQDPSFASPLALAALAKLFAAMFGWEDPQQAMREAHACVSEALQRDPLEPMALACNGAIAARIGNHDIAQAHARKAVELNPSYAWGRYGLGFIQLLHGDPQSGVSEIRTAIRLSPNDMMKPMMLASLSACHYMAGEFQQAREVALLGTQEAPHYPMNYRSLASACGAFGLVDEGKRALARFLNMASGYSSDVARRTLPFRRDEDFRRYMHGIEQLGWTG